MRTIKLSKQVIELLPNPNEWINKEILKKYNFISWKESIKNLHNPDIEDSFKEKDKKSLKPLKKKDFIILEQTKKRYQKDITTDKQKINYFLQEIDDDHLYDPIYKTFIDTPRNPDELIERSLREIVQKLFSRQFKIVRGN